MRNSLRFRLTFYYTAAFAIVLLVLALAMYAILQQENVQRIDADISQLADSFLTTVQAELKDQPGPDPLKLSIDEAITEHSFRDYVFAVFAADGKLIDSSPANFPTHGKAGFSAQTLFGSESFQQFTGPFRRLTCGFCECAGKRRTLSRICKEVHDAASLLHPRGFILASPARRISRIHSSCFCLDYPLGNFAGWRRRIFPGAPGARASGFDEPAGFRDGRHEFA